jgi:molybdopterin synthase sulfur carrier subunit
VLRRGGTTREEDHPLEFDERLLGFILNKMKLLYFSILREKLKKDQEEIAFNGSVRELRLYLVRRYPDLKDILERIKFAVNEEYVDDNYQLKGDERVALIPPVSGG